MCFSCFCSSYFVSYSSFYFAFAPCHHYCYCLMCYVTPHLTLQLFGMVHRSLPCVITTWCGVSPSPCTTIFVVFHLLPCTNVACYGVSSFILRYFLLWFVTLTCSTIVFYCGLLSLALPYYSLLWCVTLTLCCCYSLWFVIPHLVLLLHHSMPFLGTHSIVLLVLLVVVCHSLPCVITDACLLKWCTFPLFFAMCRFWNLECELKGVVCHFRKVKYFFCLKINSKVLLFCFEFAFFFFVDIFGFF